MAAKRDANCKRKKRFHDKQHALAVIRNFQVHSTRQDVPKRAYQCGHCQGWHITKAERIDRPSDSEGNRHAHPETAEDRRADDQLERVPCDRDALRREA